RRAVPGPALFPPLPRHRRTHHNWGRGRCTDKCIGVELPRISYWSILEPFGELISARPRLASSPHASAPSIGVDSPSIIGGVQSRELSGRSWVINVLGAFGVRNIAR